MSRTYKIAVLLETTIRDVTVTHNVHRTGGAGRAGIPRRWNRREGLQREDDELQRAGRSGERRHHSSGEDGASMETDGDSFESAQGG